MGELITGKGADTTESQSCLWNLETTWQGTESNKMAINRTFCYEESQFPKGRIWVLRVGVKKKCGLKDLRDSTHCVKLL